MMNKGRLNMIKIMICPKNQGLVFSSSFIRLSLSTNTVSHLPTIKVYLYWEKSYRQSKFHSVLLSPKRKPFEIRICMTILIY